MADNVVIDNGDLTDFTASTDETQSGHAARVKLAMSADGADEHVPADSHGLLVNLGANNDVTITGSLPALSAGTAAFGKLAPNSGVDIGDVDVTSVVPGFGATNLGKRRGDAAGATDTAVPGLFVRKDTMGDLAGADNDYAPGQMDASGRLRTISHVADATGAAVAFTDDAYIEATPTLSTSAHAAGDVLASMSFADAAAGNAGSGHLLSLTIIDRADLAAHMIVHFFRGSVSAQAANAAHSLSDADGAKYLCSISTEGALWADHGNNRTCTVVAAVPFKLISDATLRAVAVTLGTPTYAADSLTFGVYVMRNGAPA